MRFFIAGIMQGSRPGKELHAQNYREQIAALLEQHFPDAEIYDPLADHRNSVDYEEQTARDTFYGHNRMCRQVDVVVAYAPEASMGTAIEMWEAHEHGRGAVIAISPMRTNWVIRFCAHAAYDDLDAFAAALAEGTVQQCVQEVLQAKRR